MAERYDSNERKARRLGSTVCKYDGEPVYVMTGLHVRGKQQTLEDEVYIAPLGKSTNPYDESGWKLVKYTDDKFSYQSVELGYCNYKESAVYLQRTPHRQMYQGISGYNIRNNSGVDTYGLIQTDAMEKCIKGDYPNFWEALENVLNGHRSCAWSREFAVHNRGRDRIVLLYRDREIGVWSARNALFKIHEARDNKFICALLKEKGIAHVIDVDA